MEHGLEDLGVFGKSISRSLEHNLLDLTHVRCKADCKITKLKCDKDPLHTLKKTVPPYRIGFGRLAVGADIPPISQIVDVGVKEAERSAS